MSFSFVDRIIEHEPRRHARGVFRVPDTVPKFPAALLVEAVGQLAAWVAMAAEGFARRPVAALAQRITLGHSFPAGTLIDLEVDVARCDRDAVLYQGTASVGGTEVTRLHKCLGPMLPLVDFDDPDAARQRFEALCAEGLAPRGYASHEWLLDLRDEDLADEQCTALLRVPPEAAFLADHFPRKPVLPATLLFDTQLRMAVRLALTTMAVEPGTFLVARVLREAKVRAFMTPGTELVIGAQVLAARRSGEIAVNAKHEGKQVASARVEIGAVSPLLSSPPPSGGD
jgi:3-hydroxymyristoyl/3-hydroxydecanoyl-(acyl carrier protein) dehydratase